VAWVIVFFVIFYAEVVVFLWDVLFFSYGVGWMINHAFAWMQVIFGLVVMDFLVFLGLDFW
jgi:hypothetical protein